MIRIRKYVIVAVVLAIGATWIAHSGGTAHATGNASFALTPASGSYTTGATVSVAISETSSAGDNTNAAQVNLSFPASLLSWQSTNLTGPFTLCAQNTHGTGTVNLACAAPSSQSGTQAIATVSFTVIAGGSASVNLVSGSDIDNTSGQSVWNGTLPSATYSLSSPTSPTPTPTPASTQVPSSGKKTVTPAKSTPTPSPKTSPSATPSKSPSPSASPSPSSTPQPAEPGSVSVTVSDPAGRVDGAKVQLNGQTQSTDSSGVVNFSGIASGSLSLNITAQGDAPFTTTVTLASGQNELISYHLTRAGSTLPIYVWLIVGLILVAGIAGGGFWFWKARTPAVPLASSAPTITPEAWQPANTPPPAAPTPPPPPRPPVV